MKGYVILSKCIDIPTAEDDGVLEAISTGLASTTVYTDIKKAKTEVATMTWNLAAEVKAENEENDEYEQVELEVEELEESNETCIKTYFQGDLLNVLTYSIMEVEI
jgi:hypothetical protein